ncbi:MAG: hypothetical protein NUV51_03835 [Sulfuricaulis sp.]|nr:hypothetical protein [Sulfuricaulis sp.]
MIISSTYTIGHPQIDGRVYVDETHVTDEGERVTLCTTSGIREVKVVPQ